MHESFSSSSSTGDKRLAMPAAYSPSGYRRVNARNLLDMLINTTTGLSWVLLQSIVTQIGLQAKCRLQAKKWLHDGCTKGTSDARRRRRRDRRSVVPGAWRFSPGPRRSLPYGLAACIRSLNLTPIVSESASLRAASPAYIPLFQPT